MSDNAFGQLKQIDFFDNIGGLNLSDSAFKVKENQAAGGINWDYSLTGGFKKRMGAPKINSSPDTQLYTLGFGLFAPAAGTAKSVFRAAGTKLQLVDTSTPSFTNLSEDTVAAGSTPFASGSTQDVQFTQFSTGTSDILWAAGGGQTSIVGAYSTSKYTTNGVPAPTASSFTATSVGSGGTLTTGTYRYTLVYRKLSTQALSNAVLEASVTCTTTDSVTLAWTLTNNDTTKYDKIYVYRSALNGAASFTTGDLVTTLASSATTYTDTGSYDLTSENVPRANNTILDNSQLPSGTYNTMTLWGHRLVVASGNQLYISGVNKSESWPTVNYITVPSAGVITALSVVSFTSPQANSLQELLVIFKDNELWVLTPGTDNDYTTWSLLKVDNTGCPQQSLVVSAQGYLAWVNWRGVFLWDGTSKPIYCSRPIEPLFARDGDIDKGSFNEALGVFFRRENTIEWFLSSKTYGTQVFSIKMDLRLTLTQIEQNMTGRTMDAVFTQDVHSFPIYAAMSYIPIDAANEQMILGDDSGYCYFMANSYTDGGAAFDFRYKTVPLNCGNPNTKKQFHAVIAWVQDIGDWNLYLDYWSEFESSAATMSTIGLPISSETQDTAVWDIAQWDVSYWDAYTPKLIPVVFNLQPGVFNSSQGSAIQLQFRNDNANEPITVHGFSLIYRELGGVFA